MYVSDYTLALANVKKTGYQAINQDTWYYVSIRKWGACKLI